MEYTTLQKMKYRNKRAPVSFLRIAASPSHSLALCKSVFQARALFSLYLSIIIDYRSLDVWGAAEGKGWPPPFEGSGGD